VVCAKVVAEASGWIADHAGVEERIIGQEASKNIKQTLNLDASLTKEDVVDVRPIGSFEVLLPRKEIDNDFVENCKQQAEKATEWTQKNKKVIDEAVNEHVREHVDRANKAIKKLKDKFKIR
jgi:hypothetical protein